MKIQFTKYLLLLITFFLINSSFAQTDMLFWFVAPEINDYHWPSNPIENRGQPTWLRFSNSEDFQITVTVSQPALGNTIAVIDIPANDTRSIEFIRGGGGGAYDLDEIENYLNNYPTTFPDPGNKGFKGLKIESTGRMTCYYEMAGPYNMELMSLKGRNALGTEFYVPFQTKYNPPNRSATYPLIYSAIDIVATEDNTEVTIEPTNDMLLILNTQTNWRTTDGPYTIILDEGETFSAVPYGTGTNYTWNIARDKDLAGTKVTATKPIAVSTKDDLINDLTGAVDMVADQIVPTNLLGMKYVIMEGRVKNGFDYVYAIAINDNTYIDVDDNGTIDYTINEGQQQQIPITNPNTIISASDTILVFHVTGINPSLIPGPPTNDYNQLGGAIIPTIDVCTGSYDVSFVRSYNSPFILNVMVRDGGQDGFELNGDASLLTGADFDEVVPGEWWTATKSFSTAQVPRDVVSNLTNVDNHLFHLGILHGSVDCFYGYFSDFNSISVVGNVGTTINQDYKACYGERVELVAYGAHTYLWTANAEPTFLTDPTAQRPVIYPTEDRKYTVYGYGDCDMMDSTEINVRVAERIIADFELQEYDWPPCSPLDVSVADFSEGANYRYKWWFGDGSGDTLIVGTDVIPDTVNHTYQNTSDTMQVRKLTLIAENDFFCKDTLETEIIVYPEIHAHFIPDILVGCNPLEVYFADSSYGNLDKYRWVFGDGVVLNTAGDVEHTFNNSNPNDTAVFNMELRLTSPFECRDTARSTIEVFPYLDGEFTKNKQAGCSPLEVTFTNSSTGEDSVSLFYGDGNQLNAATFASETHNYINTGVTVAHFPVELQAFNNEGCVKIWLDTITVYPEVQAAFALDTG
ncbi:MAG: hypothetical protein ACP5E3_13445, partial [Bacteroidales bacterium]